MRPHGVHSGDLLREHGRQEARGLEHPAARHPGVDVLQEVVRVSGDHPEEVHDRAAAEDDGEGEEDPREVGRREVEDPHEAQVDVLVAAAPDVYHHERQGGAQELDVDEGRDAGEEGPAKQEHVEEVCAAAPEAPFF